MFIFTEGVKFLGYFISNEGTAIPDEQVDVINKLQFPATRKELHSVLGFFNYFRSFVRGYSTLSQPLYDYMTKKIPLDKTVTDNFEKMKKALGSAELLKRIQLEKSMVFEIETDASHYAIGMLLFQRLLNGDKHGPIDMHSRKFTSAERNYPIRQKELLAIVEAVKKWRHHLLGNKVVVYSDHESLSSLLTTGRRPESERITRWIETLSEFDLRIVYQKGEENILADVLSRFVNLGRLEVGTYTVEDKQIERVKKSYKGHEAEIVELLKGPIDLVPAHMKTMIKKYKLIDGLLYYRPLTSSTFKVVVTSEVADEMILKLHEFGHFGMVKLWAQIHPHCYVSKLSERISQVITNCDTCQRKKNVSRNTEGYLMPSAVPRDCFTTIHLDFVTGIPVSDGYDCVLVVVCALTKFSIFIPTTKTATSIETAKLLVDEVFSWVGIPDVIKCDKDIKFMTRVFDYLLEYFQFDINTTSTNHPATNGQVEAINKLMIQTIRTFCKYDHSQWNTYLKVAQFAVNTSYSRAIRMTPYQAVYGRLARDIAGVKSFASMNTVSEDARALVERATMVKAQIRERMEEYQDAMGASANKDRDPLVFEEGEMVLIHRDAYYSLVKYRKMVDVYFGPFKLVKKINDNVFTVDLPASNLRDRQINVQHFRKYWFDDKTFRDLPVTAGELNHRASEVSAILGTDKEKKELVVTFVGCRPGHARRVSFDWFIKWVPKTLQESLISNANTLGSNRDVSEEEDVEEEF